MGTYVFNILDDRYVEPTIEFVEVRDVRRARSLAGQRLLLSPHFTSVSVVQDMTELFRIDRTEAASTAEDVAATTLARPGG